MIRTKEDYRDKLFHMRPNIYIGGQAVNRNDSRLRPGIRVMDITFDLALKEEFKGLFTATSHVTGEEINRWAHLPQNSQDLMQKQQMIRVGARRAGGCIQRCMGQDALNALAVCSKEIDEAEGTDYHKRFLTYLKWYHSN
ncbi:MAG: aromatic ring hydroxylase, partial [Desulfobacteraceae bacterium]|nr:aromatic ring hydroxylase [Desulfobacteraceae bacterium]